MRNANCVTGILHSFHDLKPVSD